MKYRSWRQKIKVNKRNVVSNISHTESMNEDALRNRGFSNKAMKKVMSDSYGSYIYIYIYGSYGWFTHLGFLMEWRHQGGGAATGKKQLLSNLIPPGNYSEIVSCHPGEPVSLANTMWGKQKIHALQWLLNWKLYFFSYDVLFHISILLFDKIFSVRKFWEQERRIWIIAFLVTKIKEQNFIIH